MISELFYNYQIDSSKNEFFYSNDNLFFIVSKELNKRGSMTEDEICSFIFSKLGTNVKQIKFRSFLDKFDYSNDKYRVKSNTLTLLLKSKVFASNLFINSCESESKLYKNLSNYIGQQACNVEKALYHSLAIDKQNTKLADEFYEAKFFTILRKSSKYYQRIDETISNIDESYKNLSIKALFEDDSLVNILVSNGIYTVGELTNLSVESLMVVFSSNIELYLSVLKEMTEEFESSYKEKIKSLIETLDERQRDVLIERNGLLSGKEKTLEEVGQMFNLTRERARQIEAKALNKITANLSLFRNIFICLYSALARKNDKYIIRNKLYEYVGNDLISGFILLLIKEDDGVIRYDDIYQIIYNNSICSVSDIKNEIIEVYGDVITKRDYEALDKLEKQIVLEEYRLLNDVCYLRKGIPERQLSLNVIDEEFPKGLRISDEDQFLKFKEAYIKKYGFWDSNLSLRLLGTYMDRNGYCQINRGTYLNRLYTVKISSKLRDKLINFIILSNHNVFYTSMYEHFKSELQELGVDNYFYLKGLIDYELPSEFHTKRNYIQVGEVKMTAKESIVNYMKSFNGAFTLNDLQTQFEGIKDYVFYNHLYSEIDNGLIWISSKKFIYNDKFVITEETKNKLKNFISSLFNSLNTKVMSTKKIYARLKLLNKELLENLKVVVDSFSLYSLLKILFKDDYYYKRPLIALEKAEDFNQETVIRDFVLKQESFNLKTIKNFTTKLSLRGLYSYLEFMEEMSDLFIQVNVDTMVSKEKINLSKQTLDEFKRVINLIFTRFDALDMSTFSGYAMLPQLDYKWNKYLFVGIIRTFFSEEYDVENTAAFYDVTNFIVKKIN